MHKITRSLAVIGSTVALTLAGTAAASAQTSFPNLSSNMPGMPGMPGGPVVNAEQELHKAAEGWAQRGTGKGVAVSNIQAQNAVPFGAWQPLVSGAQQIVWINAHGVNTKNHFFRVERNNRGALLTHLNNTNSGYAGKNYGVHVHSDATYYYINVAITN
jgi:hypothetical protein